MIDGAVRLVDAVRAIDTSVVGQTRGDRQAGAGEDDSGRGKVLWQRRGKEALQSGDGARDGVGGAWSDGGWRENISVGNA